MSVRRRAWLEALLPALDPSRDVLVAGLGANARYLPHMDVRVPCFALCDAMGAAIPLALGMALARPAMRLVVLEGDGSLMMCLNTLATVGASRAENLTALVFENGAYESSGGQALPPVVVDFAAVARATGFVHAERVGAAIDLAAALERSRQASGPALLVLPTIHDPAEPIPPYSERPDEIRLKFGRALGQSA
ncbi:MAG TPA: thiamine pyrophosphate-dependent enzyme [Methylomirabilota bacterium]|nr:thiamine pyrophosphate-dependent enzyme [Methylomirabilota bacterium]